jgi:hypothetical protein
LEEAGFNVNEASYGSVVGEDTDVCDWYKKFKDNMDAILSTKRQDEQLTDGRTNHIVAFKSCYPNNRFVGKGTEPGEPDSCERTISNAKAAYRSLMPLFQAQPEVLFVAFTAPPRPNPRRLGGRRRSSPGSLTNLIGPGWRASSIPGWLITRMDG